MRLNEFYMNETEKSKEEEEREGKTTSNALFSFICKFFVILFSSGEYVFMDSSSPTIVSNQIISSGATRTCKSD